MHDRDSEETKEGQSWLRQILFIPLLAFFIILFAFIGLSERSGDTAQQGVPTRMQCLYDAIKILLLHGHFDRPINGWLWIAIGLTLIETVLGAYWARINIFPEPWKRFKFECVTVLGPRMIRA